MPQTIVTIPGVGDVPFPDDMPQAVIDAKSKELYDRAQLAVRLQAPPRVNGPDPRGEAPTVMGGIFKLPGMGESLATLPIAAANVVPGLNVVDKPFTIPAAAVLGGLGEAAEQAVTDKPFSLNDIFGAAIRQGGLEATGRALVATGSPLQALAKLPVGRGIVPAAARAGVGAGIGGTIGGTVDKKALGAALGSLVATNPAAAGFTARAVQAAGQALPPLVRGASVVIPSIRRRLVGDEEAR